MIWRITFHADGRLKKIIQNWSWCFCLGGSVEVWCVQPWKTAAAVTVLPSIANCTESSSVATRSLTRAYLPETPPTAPCASISLLDTCWTPTSACTLQTSTVCTRPITMWSWSWPLLAQRETLSAARVSPCWIWPPTPFWHTANPTGLARNRCTAMLATSFLRCSSQTRFTWTRAAWSRSVGTTSSWVWPQPTPRRTRAAKCATSAWGAEVDAVRSARERAAPIRSCVSVCAAAERAVPSGLKHNCQYCHRFFLQSYLEIQKI